jgi:TonB family protein
VLLSIVVTTEGKATSICALKGAPFGLTTKAIKAVQDWRFEPALKDGKPVPVRVQVETTFHLD